MRSCGAAAQAGELRQPEQLAAQARRMLHDPKARRFATEFFGQWLGFYNFDDYRGVDRERFPEFTPALQTASTTKPFLSSSTSSARTGRSTMSWRPTTCL